MHHDSASKPARIPLLPVDEAKAAADEAGVPDYMAELSIFQALLNHPRLAGGVQRSAGHHAVARRPGRRLRELVIMRIGWLTGCDYEWTQHWRVASRLGVSAEDLVGVRDWPGYDGFGPAERAVLAATDDIVRDGAVSGTELGGMRARIERRYNSSHRAGHRDRRVADGCFDPAEPGGPAGGGRGQLATRRAFAFDSRLLSPERGPSTNRPLIVVDRPHTRRRPRTRLGVASAECEPGSPKCSVLSFRSALSAIAATWSPR